MERNTLLAIVLSALVLFTYQTMFVPPKQAIVQSNAQINATQEIGSTNNSLPVSTPVSSTQTTTSLEKPIDFVLKTTEAVFSYTKMGGSLHNIDFLGNSDFPITNVLSIGGLDNVQYSGRQEDDKIVTLRYQDKNWQITKTFDTKDKNFIKVRMEIKNMSEISILNKFVFSAFEIDLSSLNPSLLIKHYGRGGSPAARETALYEYSVYANNKIFRKGNAVKFNDKNYKSEIAKINWVGFRDHYNALVIKPEFETKGYEIKADSDQMLTLSIQPQDKNLAPGESAYYDFSIYAGSQNPWAMKKYDMGFEKIVAFSNFPIIEWIGQAIYHTIPFLHNIFKSWGVAIILISILIKSK